MNCRGTTPPTILSTNSNPLPDGSGSTSIWQIPNWPWPPVCLTLRPSPWAFPPNVSRSGTRSVGRLHLHAVPRAQPVEQHVRVGLAHAPQHQLAGLGVVLQPQRRVLGHQPPQRLRQLVLVRLGLGRDRHRQQRLGHRPRLHQQRLVLAPTGCRRSPRWTAWRRRRCRRPRRPATGALLLAQRRGERARSARRRRGRRARARPGRARRRGPPRPAAGCRRTPGPG